MIAKKGVVILTTIIILFIISFILYRYFSFVQEKFEADISIPGLTSSILNNPNDSTYLNIIDNPSINFSVDKTLNDTFTRVKQTLQMDTINPDFDSSERWWVQNNSVVSTSSKCPNPPAKINQIISSPAPPSLATQCIGMGQLRYIQGVDDLKVLNNNRTIIVKYSENFPVHPNAKGYIISGLNVPTGTTISDYNVGLSTSGKEMAIYIDLNQPITSISNAQVFCYTPPSVDCAVSWSPFGPCKGTCGQNGVQTQTATIVTNPSWGGKACPALTNTQKCQMPACPVDCQQNNPWIDTSDCSVSCGGGTKTQTRFPPTQPTNGGANCTYDQNLTTQIIPCNTQKCINSQLQIRVGQNCDNYSGWQNYYGVGIFQAGKDYPSDASYITVPIGLTAVLTIRNGASQTVVGPSEFNFCSRGGFNDSVIQIIVYVTSESSKLQVRLGQNCDNYSGWQKLLGVGTWQAGNSYPADASYITVSDGLTAILTSSNFMNQTVVGPSEFNFCSRGGFNDSVIQVVIFTTPNPNCVGTNLLTVFDNSKFGGASDTQGIVFSADGSTLFVTEYHNANIYEINISSKQSTSLVNFGGGRNSYNLWGICLAKNGDIYVTSNNTMSIWKVLPNGQRSVFSNSGAIELTIGSDGYMYSVTNGGLFKINKNGQATQINIRGINIWQYNSVKMGPDGKLYILDCNGHKIVKCNTDGSNASVLAGSPNGISGENDGKGTDARFNYPVGMTMDNNGNIYTGDVAGNQTIRMVTPDGTVSTLFKNQAAIGFAINPLDNKLYFTESGAIVKSLSLCQPIFPQPLYDLTGN